MSIIKRLFGRRVETLDPRAAYAQWAAAYPPRAHNALMEAEQAAVLELLPEVRGKAVLDLGCGTGRYGRMLRERGALVVAGVDLSFEMLRAGGDDCSGQADWLALPFPAACFDDVVSGLTIGHVPDLGCAMRELARVLRPGGVAVYSTVHPGGRFLGWQRSFRINGRTLAVKTHPHLISDHFAAAGAAGFRVTALREPRLDDEGPPVALIVRLEALRGRP